jgi:hypothetical protein
MKLILSRKGFDSTPANGGCPSPILDGRLCSLPIPDSGALTTYGKISGFQGLSIAQIVEDLTRGRFKRSDGAHLDPDLRRTAIARAPRWRPIFGQASKAQGHLANHGIGPGDLFLFFGYFRRAEKVGGAFRFVRGAPKLHVIFGWLQVGCVAEANGNLAAQKPWAAKHPHLTPRLIEYENNTLYFGSDGLSSIGLNTNGAGTFDQIRSELILTETDSFITRTDSYVNCSVWKLPCWFAPTTGRTPLTYHSDLTRWTDCGTWTRLRSVAKGQEFVLDLEQYPEAYEWLRSIFLAANS